MEGEEYDPLTLIYQYDPEGRARLAVSFNVTVEKASHDGDLELIAINYRTQLYSRSEFEK